MLELTNSSEKAAEGWRFRPVEDYERYLRRHSPWIRWIVQNTDLGQLHSSSRYHTEANGPEIRQTALSTSQKPLKCRQTRSTTAAA